jgi:hypothetical protein
VKANECKLNLIKRESARARERESESERERESESEREREVYGREKTFDTGIG